MSSAMQELFQYGDYGQKDWLQIGGKLLEVTGKGAAILSLTATLTDLITDLVKGHKDRLAGDLVNFVLSALIFYLVAINETIAKLNGTLAAGTLIYSRIMVDQHHK